MRSIFLILLISLISLSTKSYANEPACATPRADGGEEVLTLMEPVDFPLLNPDPVENAREEIAEEFQEAFGDRAAADPGAPGLIINFTMVGTTSSLFGTIRVPRPPERLIVPYDGSVSLEKAVLDHITGEDNPDPSPCDPSRNGDGSGNPSPPGASTGPTDQEINDAIAQALASGVFDPSPGASFSGTLSSLRSLNFVITLLGGTSFSFVSCTPECRP